jgi:predicted nucleic acid-binding protein
MNLVDSSAWLAYFADEPTADSFAEAIEDSDLLLVPAACINEVFKVVLRERGEDDAFPAVAAMQQGTMVDLDADLAVEAASVGLEEGLSFADAAIYTVAKKHGATLWTQDAHFAGKPGVQYQAKTTRA